MTQGPALPSNVLYKKFLVLLFTRLATPLAHFFPLTISLNVELALNDG